MEGICAICEVARDGGGVECRWVRVRLGNTFRVWVDRGGVEVGRVAPALPTRTNSFDSWSFRSLCKSLGGKTIRIPKAIGLHKNANKVRIENSGIRLGLDSYSGIHRVRLLRPVGINYDVPFRSSKIIINIINIRLCIN